MIFDLNSSNRILTDVRPESVSVTNGRHTINDRAQIRFPFIFTIRLRLFRYFYEIFRSVRIDRKVVFNRRSGTLSRLPCDIITVVYIASLSLRNKIHPLHTVSLCFEGAILCLRVGFKNVNVEEGIAVAGQKAIRICGAVGFRRVKRVTCVLTYGTPCRDRVRRKLFNFLCLPMGLGGREPFGRRERKRKTYTTDVTKSARYTNIVNAICID